MATEHLTAQAARTALDYSLITGKLYWRTAAGRFGRIKSGTEAGCVDTNGRLRVRVAGRLFLAHRLAWLITTGEWPDAMIDHINGEPLNNAWHNLRLASGNVNRQNVKGPQSNNTSGYLGVYFSRGKWYANIGANRSRIRLGCFETPAGAYTAYLTAKRLLHDGNTL